MSLRSGRPPLRAPPAGAPAAPANRFGFLIIWGGLAIMASSLGATGLPSLVAVGTIAATLPLAVLVHVLHAYPSGRLATRSSRVIVIAGYVVCLVLQALLYLFGASPAPYDGLLVPDRPDLVALGHVVQVVAGCAVMVATVVILVGRLRRADPRRRRALAPCTDTASPSCCSSRPAPTC